MTSRLIPLDYVTTAAHDVRLAIRSMRRTPAIAAALVLTLALGLGVAIGTIGALNLTRSLQTLLFGVAASDWRISLVVAATVVAAAVLSDLAPALGAGAESPGVAMRQE